MRYKVEQVGDSFVIVDQFNGYRGKEFVDYGNAEEYCLYCNDMQAEAEFEIEAKAYYRAKEVEYVQDV